MNGSRICTLLTDFATVDGYVGAMKGAVLAGCPTAQVVDITHDIPPQSVAGGARALAAAAPWFPAGTVHVAVVDPGVGTARRALCVEAFGQRFLGPDNGLLTVALDEALARPRPLVYALDRLPPGWPLSPTFHGRDLFARVAGLLLAGAAPADFSSGTVADPLRLPEPEVVVASDGALVGEVVHVDAFGNLCTNVTAAALRASLPAAARGAPLAGRFICDVGGCQVPLVSTYGQAEVGALLACVGSTGNVEIAVRNGSAERDLAVTRGAPVTVVVRDPAEERR